jgi:DNA-binding GntR family transcriptional regulator
VYAYAVTSTVASALERFREQPRQTAYQSVLTALREAILTGALPGGTRLVQAELAGHFGVSNTPVREALRQLASEGLVQFDSYRGAVVLAPTVEEVIEVYELLLLLEPEIARKAAERITPEELAELERLNEQMHKTEEVSAWVPLNRSFHGVIHDAARSARLAGIIGGLMDSSTVQVASLLTAGVADVNRSNMEHTRLVKALARHDSDRAAAAMTKHLTTTLSAVRSAQS